MKGAISEDVYHTIDKGGVEQGRMVEDMSWSSESDRCLLGHGSASQNPSRSPLATRLDDIELSDDEDNNYIKSYTIL